MTWSKLSVDHRMSMESSASTFLNILTGKRQNALYTGNKTFQGNEQYYRSGSGKKRISVNKTSQSGLVWPLLWFLLLLNVFHIKL